MQLVSPQDQEAVGSRIKHLRFAKGITQIAMAEALGVTPSYVSAIERGKKSVTRRLLEKLVELFGVSEKEILVKINDQKTTENVVPIVAKMSYQSEKGRQNEPNNTPPNSETDAQRAQEIDALWSQLVHREGLDLVGIHYAGFTSLLGVYSDRVLAYVADKAEQQLRDILGEHLDKKIDTQEARIKLRKAVMPLNAIHDKILAVDQAIYGMMEDVFKIFPDAMELVKGTVIPVNMMPVTQEMLDGWAEESGKNREANAALGA